MKQILWEDRLDNITVLILIENGDDTVRRVDFLMLLVVFTKIIVVVSFLLYGLCSRDFLFLVE